MKAPPANRPSVNSFHQTFPPVSPTEGERASTLIVVYRLVLINYYALLVLAINCAFLPHLTHATHATNARMSTSPHILP